MTSPGVINDIRNEQEGRAGFYRSMLRRFSLFLFVIAVIVGGSSLYNSFTIHQVRTSQISNTKCSQASNHALAYDLKKVTTPGETPAEFLKQIKIPSAKC